MKKLFIVANWKSNKTLKEAELWLHDFKEGVKKNKISLESKEIIISPSFTLFEHVHYCSGNLKLPLKFAAQNISPFSEGPYTGEVNGRQIKELADYVLIGHSERREHFSENDETLFKKVSLSKQFGLVPIFCIQGRNTSVPKGIGIVAYEPIDAIGTGNPDTPENAEEVALFFKKSNVAEVVLYGGSVIPDNVKSFTQMPNIDGVLVGKGSLSSLEFVEIVRNA